MVKCISRYIKNHNLMMKKSESTQKTTHTKWNNKLDEKRIKWEKTKENYVESKIAIKIAEEEKK